MKSSILYVLLIHVPLIVLMAVSLATGHGHERSGRDSSATEMPIDEEQAIPVEDDASPSSSSDSIYSLATAPSSCDPLAAAVCVDQ